MLRQQVALTSHVGESVLDAAHVAGQFVTLREEFPALFEQQFHPLLQARRRGAAFQFRLLLRFSHGCLLGSIQNIQCVTSLPG